MTQPEDGSRLSHRKGCEVLLLDDTTWAKGAEGLFHLRIQIRQWQELQSQIEQKCVHPVTSPQLPETP